MAIQLDIDTTRIAAQTTTAAAQDDVAAAAQAKKAAPLLGGENVKVTSGAMTDLEKLVARLKNESEATRQSVTQRRISILQTVLDSMADKVTEAERENLLKIEELNGEKGDLEKELAGLRDEKSLLESMIESLDRQIEQAVKDGKEHLEQVEKLKRQRAEEQAKLDGIDASIKSIASKIAGIDVKIAECSKVIASSTLNEVFAALKSAADDAKPGAEKNETQAERDRADAKDVANNIALHISAALDRIDGQIRAVLDEAQMKVEG